MKLGLLGLVFASLTLTATAASANLLTNGDIETGSFSPITGNGVNSAASNFQQWSGNDSSVTTELLTNAELQSLYGTSSVTGNNALLVTTTGANDGLFSYNFSHAAWNNTASDMTLSAWVYVIQGDVLAGLGSNRTGFNITTTNITGQWEFLSTSNTGSPNINEELIVYANSGASTFLIDGLWLNTGLTSENPAQPSVVPVPAAIWLFGSGLLGLLGVAKRKRAQAF